VEDGPNKKTPQTGAQVMRGVSDVAVFPN